MSAVAWFFLGLVSGQVVILVVLALCAVSHDESLAWFQASRRPSDAPLDGEDDYSRPYQDEYQRLWHEAAAERDHLRAENEQLRNVERAARRANYSLGDLRDQAVLKHALEALARGGEAAS